MRRTATDTEADSPELSGVRCNSHEGVSRLRRALSWRTIAKRILPLPLQNLLRGFIQSVPGVSAYGRDYWRFLSYSGIRGQGEEARLRARITAQYHVLEKGLSHHDLRLGFGGHMVTALVASLWAYREAGYPTSCSQYQSAIAVLECYRALHASQNAQVPSVVDQFLEHVAGTVRREFSGGYHEKRGEELLACWRGDFRSLATHRHSIRHFSDCPVHEEALWRAISLARWAPSACNRQLALVHVFRSKHKISEILELHGGARGFVQLVDTLLLITVDLRGYFGFAERNLGYVDAGLFAMALMYALCYEGIASCPLHLALPPAQEGRLRRMAGLRASETGVVILAVGNVPKSLRVAHSQRKPLDEYVSVH